MDMKNFPFLILVIMIWLQISSCKPKQPMSPDVAVKQESQALCKDTTGSRYYMVRLYYGENNWWNQQLTAYSVFHLYFPDSNYYNKIKVKNNEEAD